MSVIDLIKEFIQFLAPLFLLFILLFPRRFYQFLGDRLKEEWRRDTEVQLQELLKKRPQTDKFYKDQYDLILKVWSILNDARNSVSELWMEASFNNALRLGENLMKLAELVNKQELLLKREHLDELERIYKILLEFQAGKVELVKLTEDDDYSNYQHFKHDIEDQIKKNEGIKEEFDRLLNEIRDDFHMSLGSLD